MNGVVVGAYAAAPADRPEVAGRGPRERLVPGGATLRAPAEAGLA